jgi:hypothetical protein
MGNHTLVFSLLITRLFPARLTDKIAPLVTVVAPQSFVSQSGFLHAAPSDSSQFQRMPTLWELGETNPLGRK